MVRSYKRKTQIGTVSSLTIKQAAEQVVSRQMSLCEAASTFGVAKTTLFHYVTKMKSAADARSVSFCPNYVVCRVFTDEQKSLIADYLLQAAKLHHGLSSWAARQLAFDFSTANRIDTPSNWQFHQCASEDWLLCFMKRHPPLSLRTPEATSLSRATSFNITNVGKYFGNLEEVMRRHNFGPHQVYNVDETGVTTVHQPGKVIAGRGIKQVGKVTSTECGTLVALCCAANAVGNVLHHQCSFFRECISNPPC